MRSMIALVGVSLCVALLAMPVPAVGAGDYIVVLKDRFSPKLAARRHRAVPTHIYKYALRGYAATLSDAALARAQVDPRVDYVAPDEPLYATGQAVPTGVRLIGGLKSKTA